MSLASGSFVGVDHRNVKIHTASDVTVVYTPPTDSQGKFTVDGTTDPAAREITIHDLQLSSIGNEQTTVADFNRLRDQVLADSTYVALSGKMFTALSDETPPAEDNC
ncbi:hypothetical protein I317_05185 [Kwoniella heveanensis CBS 569]|nr:hypothetical protein I317_05185 [Kwoniella heveanensis CBS 569]